MPCSYKSKVHALWDSEENNVHKAHTLSPFRRVAACFSHNLLEYSQANLRDSKWTCDSDIISDGHVEHFMVVFLLSRNRRWQLWPDASPSHLCSTRSTRRNSDFTRKKRWISNRLVTGKIQNDVFIKNSDCKSCCTENIILDLSKLSSYWIYQS